MRQESEGQTVKPNIDVDLTPECRNCLYRKTGWICSNAKSEHSEQRVDSEDTCQHFEPNKSQAYIERAISETMMLLSTKALPEKERISREIINHYEEAIAMGLPAEDQVEAKFGIAITCAHIVSRRLEASGDTSGLKSAEMQMLLLNLTGAGEIEKKYRGDYIGRNWFQLAFVDMLLELKAKILGNEESSEADERFVRGQLAAVEHVYPTPLPRMMLRLGTYIGSHGRVDEAARCFQNVVESMSRPKSSLVPQAQKLLEEARKLYTRASTDSKEDGSARASDAGRPLKKSGCFIATAVCGSELASEVILLSRFRDDVLLQSQIGRLFVRLYYWCSPQPARLIAGNEVLRKLARLLLIRPIVQAVKRLF